MFLSHRTLVVTLVLLCGFSAVSRAADLGFARWLASQQDCYRALSEVKGFEYHSSPNPESLQIKLPCLAAEGDWVGFEQALPLFLNEPRIDAPVKRQVVHTAFEHYIETEQHQKAQRLSEKMGLTKTPLPTPETMDSLADPQAARRASAWVPGAGLWMSGRKTSGLVSLGLNTSFLYGTWWAVQNKAPAMALLLMFFEVSWYQGGINAAEEAVVHNNREKVAQEQRTWLLQTETRF